MQIRLSCSEPLRYRTKMRILIVPLLALLGSVTAAHAAASAWVELAPEVRVRLIAGGGQTAEGLVHAAIEVEMPPGTKTYWRTPGETGIATHFDLSASEGFASGRLLWPYPRIDRQPGYTDFVYSGTVVMPLELTGANGHIVLRGALLMGVCSDICVPASAELELAIDPGERDAAAALRVSQALAAVPIGWVGKPAAITELGYDADSRALRVSHEAVVDPLSVIAEDVTGRLAFGASQKSPEPGIVTIPLVGGDGDGVDHAMVVRLTFMTADGPYEVERRVKASTDR